jgi:hypothetical protein
MKPPKLPKHPGRPLPPGVEIRGFSSSTPTAKSPISPTLFAEVAGYQLIQRALSGDLDRPGTPSTTQLAALLLFGLSEPIAPKDPKP